MRRCPLPGGRGQDPRPPSGSAGYRVRRAGMLRRNGNPRGAARTGVGDRGIGDRPSENFARGLSENHARKAGNCARNHQGALPSVARRGSMSAFQPYVPPSRSLPELTARGLIVGSVLGILFAASSVYLSVKVGLTVSASIPIAVLSIAIFRAVGPASILENTIVQTVGSAGGP